MFPRFAVANVVDIRAVYSVLETQISMAQRGVSNFDDVRIGQLRQRVESASRFLESATRDTVGRIFFCRSSAQMRWIAAGWVIARMKNHEAIWNWAFE